MLNCVINLLSNTHFKSQQHMIGKYEFRHKNWSINEWHLTLHQHRIMANRTVNMEQIFLMLVSNCKDHTIHSLYRYRSH
jgi:hypothetical protein